MLIYLAMIDSPEDREWFAAMYKRNAKVMKKEANRILKDEGEAENATHEAFLSIAKHIKDYGGKPDGEMRALCIVIARHKAIDIWRRREAIPLTELGEDNHPWKSEDEPENIVLEKEEGEKFRDILDKLPEAIRSVLVMKYFHGLSNGEIAKLLGTTKKNVEMRLYRGKKQLEELLRKEGYHG